MVTTSVSGSLYEPCLVGSVGCVLLLSSTTLDSPIFFPTLSADFPEVCIIFACSSPDLLPWASAGSITEDDWARYQNISIVQYYYEAFHIIDWFIYLFIAMLG